MPNSADAHAGTAASAVRQGEAVQVLALSLIAHSSWLIA
jgi:hypothetical protein